MVRISQFVGGGLFTLTDGLNMKKQFDHSGMVMHNVAPWVVDVVMLSWLFTNSMLVHRGV